MSSGSNADLQRYLTEQLSLTPLGGVNGASPANGRPSSQRASSSRSNIVSRMSSESSDAGGPTIMTPESILSEISDQEPRCNANSDDGSASISSSQVGLAPGAERKICWKATPGVSPAEDGTEQLLDSSKHYTKRGAYRQYAGKELDDSQKERKNNNYEAAELKKCAPTEAQKKKWAEIFRALDNAEGIAPKNEARLPTRDGSR